MNARENRPPIPKSLPATLRRELESCYRELAAEIAALGVACWATGRCCDFSRVDHHLYASSVEIAFVREKHGRVAARQSDSGKALLCPFWQDGRCEERERRPLGCRTYFCDPRYRTSLEQLYEKHLARLRSAADREGYRWCYAPFLEELDR